MEVSVVIATYNRAPILRRCLSALLSQTMGGYEIIVVDDGSTDATGEVLASLRGRVRSFRTANRGPAHARNLGVRHARHGIVAFIDDDCVPEKDWIANILASFARYPDAAAVGSFILSRYGGAFRRLHPFFEKKLAACSPVWRMQGLRPNHRLSTNNCALRKAVFDEVGGFDTKFSYAGEDPDLWFRILERGHVLYSLKDFPVVHLERTDVLSLMRRHYRFGLADTVNCSDHFRGHLYVHLGYLPLRVFSRFPVTLFFYGNARGKVLLLILLCPLFSPLLAGILLLYSLALRSAQLRNPLAVLVSYALDAVTQLPCIAGRAVGSVRNGVFCL